MKRMMLVAGLAALVAAPLLATAGEDDMKVGNAVGNKMPELTGVLLPTKEGQEKSAFNSTKLEKATAYFFWSQSCPYCTSYRDRIRDMSKAYAEKGIDFVIVYPLTKESTDSKAKYHKSARFMGHAVHDEKAAIAKKMGIKKTPTFVLASKKGEILFKGGIDDSPLDAKKVKKSFATDAIDAHLAGKELKVTSAPTYG